ncbi:hypothetical protein [Ferriphaselus amnicola]|uniref:hypothetical protein n=1 Tax=Ferriphaselus amnicola TaxID=1188319 RepID=UPI00155913BA|nr:hypothetical protein [Ferriphaselus amnicola]
MLAVTDFQPKVVGQCVDQGTDPQGKAITEDKHGLARAVRQGWVARKSSEAGRCIAGLG